MKSVLALNEGKRMQAQRISVDATYWCNNLSLDSQ